jgi:hypothetical protein
MLLKAHRRAAGEPVSLPTGVKDVLARFVKVLWGKVVYLQPADN